jgi:hypothetical protein
LTRKKLFACISHDKPPNCKATKTRFGSGIEELAKASNRIQTENFFGKMGLFFQIYERNSETISDFLVG